MIGKIGSGIPLPEEGAPEIEKNKSSASAGRNTDVFEDTSTDSSSNSTAVSISSPAAGHEALRLDSLLRAMSFDHLHGAIQCANDRLQFGTKALDPKAIEQNLSRSFPQATTREKLKMNLISMQVVMGDVTGALQSMITKSEQQNRQFNHQIVDKFDEIREARDKVIRAFAEMKPPRAYAGSNPETSARSQDRQSAYTQFVQMTTQLMSEYQNKERDLVDELNEVRRSVDSLWEAYFGFKEQDSRTTSRVIQER